MKCNIMDAVLLLCSGSDYIVSWFVVTPTRRMLRTMDLQTSVQIVVLWFKGFWKVLDRSQLLPLSTRSRVDDWPENS